MKISLLPKVISQKSEALDEPYLPNTLKNLATDKPKAESPLWTPISYRDNGRKAAFALEVCALVFDFDKGRPETVLERVQVEHYWHTTHSHTVESPKWRLIIPLDKPVQAKDWVAFYTKAAQLLDFNNYDTSCSDLAQFFYIPPVSSTWEIHSGRPLPTDDVNSYTPTDFGVLRTTLLRAPNPDYKESIRKALSSQPIAEPGRRENTVTGLGFYLGKHIVPPQVSLASVLTLIGPGLSLKGSDTEPERPKEHWVKKFSTAFENGRKQKEEKALITGPRPDWENQLMFISKANGDKQLVSNTYNANLILKNHSEFSFRKNLLSSQVESWDGANWRDLSDEECTRITNWLQTKYYVTVHRNAVHDQISELASPYDPLQSYLESQEWDGVERVNTFLVKYFGCEDTPATALFSRKWLLCLVARAIAPGCKMDNVLVLQGKQGYGKSTALRLLTEPWFSDTKIVIGDKDSLLLASESWCHEFAELASLKKADLETMKAFFTAPTDKFRPPYGRSTVTRPRRCVFVATTNEDEFLNDPTGSRRFWTVRVVKQIDFEAIKRDRAQIFSEAYKIFKTGEPYWLSTDEEQRAQRDAATEFSQDGTEDDAYSAAILDWWDARPSDKRPLEMKSAFVAKTILDIPVNQTSQYTLTRIGASLRALGFVSVRKYIDVKELAGGRSRHWAPSERLLNRPQRDSQGRVVGLKKVTGGNV